MLKVGVIGAGRMGQVRALAAKALGADIVYIFDPDGTKAQALACQVEATAINNHRDVNLEELDALFLCTPPSVREIGVRAIESGVHLLVEKPLGLSADACAPLLCALDNHKVVTAVGFMNRYREGVLHAKATLEKEDVLGLSVHWFGGRYGVPWWSDPAQSGGPINEQCCHLVDLCRYLIGEIVLVQALTPDDDRAPESLALSLRFADGQLGTVLYSCKANDKTIGIQVVTSHGSIQLEGWDFRSPDVVSSFKDKNAIFEVETRRFFNAITEGDTTSILSDIHDALRTQRTVDAVILSAATKKAVEIRIF